MQSLSDDESRKVLGKVLADQLQAILEYVQGIPLIDHKLQTIDDRLIRVERMVEAHEVDIRYIRHHLAI